MFGSIIYVYHLFNLFIFRYQYLMQFNMQYIYSHACELKNL